jgi:hypothetical protein
MRPTWLIEANVEGLPSGDLQEEVRRQGMTCRVVKHLPNLSAPKDIAGGEGIPFDACVVFRGSLGLMRHIQRTRHWKPGGWCSFANLACSTYYAHFGPFLLNRDYTLLPVGEALRLTDTLFARHGVNNRLFVRPDSVEKSFTGVLADKLIFTRTISALSFDPTTLVLVARPRRLLHEWRLIVANGRVIAGSQYRNESGVTEEPGGPDEVMAFATSVLEKVEWRPDPLFAMDVCNSEDGFRVVELNSFSCSGQYLADLRPIVEAASAVAASSW